MRGRIRRAAVAFVVGAITILPLSAMAAPVTTGDTTVLGAEKPDTSNAGNDGQAPERGGSEEPGRSSRSGNTQEQSDEGDTQGNSGNDPHQSDEGDAPADEGDAPGNSGNDPHQFDDGDAQGNSGNAPGQSDEGDAPGNSGNAPGQSDEGDALGNAGNAPGHTGAAPGLAPNRPEPSDPGPVGRPAVTPSGVVPGSNGFGSLDPGAMSEGLGAAVLMFDVDGDSVRLMVTPAEPHGIGLSSGVLSALGPVVPPGVAEVLTSPLVVFEALLEAMASSGQSLVIPFLAGAIGFFLPGMRRRHILEAVTGD